MLLALLCTVGHTSCVGRMRAGLSGELPTRASMLSIKLLAFDEGVRDDHQTYAIAAYDLWATLHVLDG